MMPKMFNITLLYGLSALVLSSLEGGLGPQTNGWVALYCIDMLCAVFCAIGLAACWYFHHSRVV